MALADYADEEWSCHPSVAQLAKFTSQGHKTVRDHLDALEKDGILSRTRQRREDGTLGRYRFFIQRHKLPVANFARGEKHPKPVANFATHNPHSNPHIKEDTNVSSKRRVKDQDFEAWYSHYPHKVQRGAAERAFPKALAQASLQELIDGVHRYIESKPVDRPYQNPATWLNGKGWLDQPADPPTDLRQGRARQPRGADHFMISAMEDLKNEQFRNGQGEGDFGDDVPGFPFLLEHERR